MTQSITLTKNNINNFSLTFHMWKLGHEVQKVFL